jgi:hypothetical protein
LIDDAFARLPCAALEIQVCCLWHTDHLPDTRRARHFPAVGLPHVAENQKQALMAGKGEKGILQLAAQLLQLPCRADEAFLGCGLGIFADATSLMKD